MNSNVRRLHLCLARAAAASLGLYVPLLYVEVAQEQEAAGAPLTVDELRWLLIEVYAHDVLAETS